MNNNVFRKVSVERLSSPEQLDTLMKVTAPRGWLALLALGLLLIVAIVWGFFGSMETKLQSQGVLIKPGGLQSIYASSTGSITDIRVLENDFVNKGDVIARIEQPGLLEQLKQTTVSYEFVKATYQVTPSPELAEKMASLKESISQIQNEYATASRVVSAYSGRVLEVKVKKNNVIGAGMPLITVESGAEKAKDLEVVMYLPVHDGKKIIPGMKVGLSPSSINKQEFGFMIGRVTSVSEFPTSLQGMMVTIGNEALVQELAGKGSAMLEVHVDLVPDSRTTSGYKWSTGDGPPTTINSGTLVYGSITIKEQKPITSVIPQIK